MRLLIVALFSFAVVGVNAQDTLFYDDFESGTSSWFMLGSWGTTSDSVFAGSNALTESPSGNYDDLENNTATMTTGVDLSTALDATVIFQTRYKIEAGFDTMFLEGSTDGVIWTTIKHYSDETHISAYTMESVSLGAFVGNSSVKVRFRIKTDGALTYTGMFIDNFMITSSSVDGSPPLIKHQPTDMLESSLGAHYLTTELLDVSGISSTSVTYMVDGGAPSTVSGSLAYADKYTYTIPAQSPGACVDYYFNATDASTGMNTTSSDTFSYVAGNYIKYDGGEVDFVNSYGPSSPTGNTGAAVRITLGGATTLTTMIIRNYTDPTRTNDSMQIHVWDESGGFPGTDLITPFMVYPAAKIGDPNRPTKIDLRPYSGSLSGLTGDIFIGFTVPTGEVWVAQQTPAVGDRTFFHDGSAWDSLTGDDYHFRAITTAITGAPSADFTFVSSADPTIVFTDASTGTPTKWHWDFGDGDTSNLTNPSHMFTDNGMHTVCLTVWNAAGMDKVCKTVTVSNVASTVADFTFSGDPMVNFTDASTNSPYKWKWYFGDGSISTLQNPTHTYTANGTYNVCLKATNGGGSDSICKSVSITSYTAPIANFSFDPSGDPVVDFTDLSTEFPTKWHWDFGDGDTANIQHPNHTYTSNGTFNVCLIATNSVGSSSPSCKNVVVSMATGVGTIALRPAFIYPNPADDFVIVPAETSTQLPAVYDLQGRLVTTGMLWNGNGWRLDLQDLSQGVYIIELQEDDQVVSRSKLIVE